ncbi:MAG: hypothetical protein LBV41_10400 [Cytophagaceae bacterium]|jgi:hypothetical protein|nr:hypothetical protein [Cytophagaceae bacterium]
MKMRFSNHRLISVLLALIALPALHSCGERRPKVDHIEINSSLIPFYDDLFSIVPDSASIEQQKERLIEQYGSYLEMYSRRIVGAGATADPYFSVNMAKFLSYEANREVVDTCRKVFADLASLENEITHAFQYYRYYFPEKAVPDVYLHISGFNQSIAVDSGVISVSIEKYLGKECVFYEWLETPIYLRKQMIPEKVVPDIAKAIVVSEFAYNDSIDDLLSQMVYNGMALYFVKKINPDISNEYLLDMTVDEIKWCRQYERMVWASMVEQKHLYTTDRMVMLKYVGDAPYSYYLGQDSPGKAGIYMGYRIVETYMKQHPETTLSQLMQRRDYHRIFIESKYRP